MHYKYKKKNKISEILQTNVATLCANLSFPLNRIIHLDDVSEQIEERFKNTLFFDGISANEGVTKGIAFARYNIIDLKNIPDKKTQDEDEETLFNNAVRNVQKNLQEMLERITNLAGKDEGILFKAYLQMIYSHRFYDAIIYQIRKGIWVQTAIKNIVLKQANFF